MTTADNAQLDQAKFKNPHVTAKGEERAIVALTHLHTLWFNTGTLCNITCANCYIESSPLNDRLVYLQTDEVVSYLNEIQRDNISVKELGFTGGEPFMNPDFPDILEESLKRGFDVLILTNAMKPMHNKQKALQALGRRFGKQITLNLLIHRRQCYSVVKRIGSYH